MHGKWLLIGTTFLILGAALFGLGLYNYPNNEVKTQEISNQTGTTIFKFSPSFNYSTTVTFNIVGNYTVGNTTWLSVVNQTGAFEYYERIINFPISVQLSNSSKEYVADFENIGISNTTVITVSENQLIKENIYPLNYLVIASPIIVLASLLVLIGGGFLSLVKMKKLDKGKNQTLVNIGFVVFAYGFILFVYILMTVNTTLPTLALLFGFSVNSLIATLIITSVPIISIAAYIIAIFYFKRVDLKSNFKQIMAMRRFYYYFQFVFFGAFPFFFLFPINSIFFVGFFAFLAICIIFFVSIPFVAMPSTEGIIIAAFLDFLDEYEVKGCKARFDSIKLASKRIIELIEPFNLAISESCLTSSISYNALVENDTEAISEIIEYVEETPLEYGNLVPVLQDLVCKGDSLDKKGIKALPALTDKLEKYFGLMIPLISSIVAAIVTIILRLFFRIGG